MGTRRAKEGGWSATKASSRLGTPVIAGIVLLAIASSAVAAGPDTVFTVGNYPVEARADNAVAAKERALADGQQAALRSLLKRLVPVSAYAQLKRFAGVKASDLVEGVSVRAERNSSTDYIASLDFSFQSRAIRELLRREHVAFIDEQAPALTVIPVWRAAAGAPAKDDAAWSGVWKSLDLEHALTPVKLQTLKPNIQAATINSLAEGDGSVMRVLANEYRSELVVLALAQPDPVAKRLNVVLSGRDAVGAFTLKRAYRLDASDPAYASELAAVVGLGILEGRWKAIKLRGGTGAAAPGSDLQIAVEFRGMSEWQDISRKLSAIPGVEELDVAGLSARSARVTLRYGGGAERLAEALAQQGLALRNAGGNWVLHLQ